MTDPVEDLRALLAEVTATLKQMDRDLFVARASVLVLADILLVKSLTAAEVVIIRRAVTDARPRTPGPRLAQ
jgi:hypothetical protein